MAFGSSLAVLSLFATLWLSVHGHSWIACTDYAEYNGLYYSNDKCQGWARSGWMYAPTNQPFGYESGFAYVPTETAPCKTLRNDACGYNSDQPMAIYYNGQVVVINHPTKNHCNDPRCGDTHNQDNGNYMYAVPTTVNATTDPSLDMFMAPSNLIANMGISPVAGRPGYVDADFTTYPKPGFQNAPAYCSGNGTDKAMATNNFTIPASWKQGRYTFMWIWFMGCPNVTCAYTTCWEADVYPTKAAAATARANANQPAHQDAAVEFDGTWGGGADGTINMPAAANSTYVLVTFPFVVGSFSAGGAIVNQTSNAASYILYQQGLMYQPPQATFTVLYVQQSYLLPCGTTADQIATYVFNISTPVSEALKKVVRH